jgi:hypothetical protein
MFAKKMLFTQDLEDVSKIAQTIISDVFRDEASYLLKGRSIRRVLASEPNK